MTGLFSAVILMKSKVVGDSSGDDSLFEESTRLLEASDEQDAKLKAEQLGRAAHHSYANEKGEQVEWVFVEVLEVQDLCEEKYFSGIEVHSRLSRSAEYPKG